ncbi:MAG: hypothetical protein JXR51_13155 [Bacteroidales bacterium]|nr:hypothetical protein [Bacteroidales bacterium]MBN2758119.1 hypothetical protein [Bacteroidales bacterium]
MKKLFLLSFIAIFIFACNNSTTDENSENNDQQSDNKDSNISGNNSFVEYPFESGIIEFKNEIMGASANMTLYFKDHGKIECTVSETEMMGTKMTVRSIVKDGYFYTLSMEQKMGSKFKVDAEVDNENVSMHTFQEKYLAEVGGKKEGTEKILDKECQVYSFAQDGVTYKIWVWKNLIMKMLGEQNGMQMLKEATKIEETSSFPDGIFDIPSDFNITEEKDMNTESDDDFTDENAEG